MSNKEPETPDEYGSVAVLNSNLEWKRYDIPMDVFVYIQQLESFVHNPDISQVREVYKERFGKGGKKVDTDFDEDLSKHDFRFRWTDYKGKKKDD